MPFHDAVGINKGQMSSIWAKGYVLMIVCVLSDSLLGGGRRSWYIIMST